MKIKISNPAEVAVVKPAIEQMLYSGAVTITFTKLTGESRKMLCTTNPSLVNEPVVPKKSHDTVKVVFDLEKKEWRSFRWDSIKKVIQSET